MNAQDHITRFWDDHAHAYESEELTRLYEGNARPAWSDMWRRVLSPAPADVLDVGAGTGHVSVLLAELGHRVVGIDLARGMLALAQERCAGMAAPPTMQLGDAVAPGFPPGSFDAVVSRFLLWTLREPERAFANWRVLLRPGGVVVAVDGLWFARVCPASVRAALSLSGLDTVEPIVAAFHAAGFQSVRSAPLPEIQRWERTTPIPTAAGRRSLSPAAHQHTEPSG